MEIWALSAAALASAVVHVDAELRGLVRRSYWAKPLTTTLILVLALVLPGPAAEPYRLLVVAGLAFSLAGDVFLMLPSDRFVPGLASFLVAHLLYIAAFAGAAGFWAHPAAALPGALLAGALLAWLWPHLGTDRGPVLLYVAVIATMGWQALSQWLALETAAAACAGIGAALFIVSDSALAINRFRGAFRLAPLAVLGTYYPAQWAIALSVAR